MKSFRFALFAAAAAVLAAPAHAQDTKVAIGMSGWTGFAPLTLAKEAGLFAKHGLDVSIKKIPQKDRHLAIASGDIQCAATTVETWIVWNANGVATTQIFQLDKSYGADGMVVKPGINKIADLKGKKVAADAPGTATYFTLAWMLKKNGLSIKDVEVVNLSPQAAFDTEVQVFDYHEHAIGSGAKARAAAYIEMRVGDRRLYGVGIDADIVAASFKALLSGMARAQALRVPVVDSSLAD